MIKRKSRKKVQHERHLPLELKRHLSSVRLAKAHAALYVPYYCVYVLEGHGILPYICGGLLGITIVGLLIGEDL